MKALVIDTWSGARYYEVEVIEETPKRIRVKVLSPNGVMLPKKKYVDYGDTVLVPKHAIKDLDDPHKLEHSYYEGHIYGYSSNPVDARR